MAATNVPLTTNETVMAQLNLFQPQPPPEHLERAIQRGKKKVAATSILSHREEMSKGKIDGLSGRIISLLKDGSAMTSRQIAKDLGSERNSVTSPIKGLEESGTIEVATVAPCPVTGKKVRWYRLRKAPER